MSDTVSPDKAAGQQAVPAMARHRSGRLLWPVTALAAFAVLCVVVLSVAPALLEVDDFAYRASIVAMTDGHFLTLSTAQTHALEAQLAGSGRGPRIAGPGGSPPSIAQWQWVQLPGGRWISEKDPGYPFLAAPFQALGIIRLAPLFYGALGCLGLFFGARRWLGPCGGAAAVGLFCSSGAALAYAWREYMPTFTEASLIAAGTGAVLWAMLAEEAAARRRTGIGLLGFLAIEAAVFVRYTDIVVLGCAVVAVLAARRLHAASTPPSALRWWLGSVALFGTGVALFDDGVYGGPLKSAYPPGEIVFSLSAIIPNLRSMPAHLLQAIPALVLALAGMAWITVRWVRLRRTGGEEHATSRRDFAVALALTLSWFSLWGLYAAYAWTTQPGLGTVQTARFYVPAMGAIALLGAWAVARLPLRVSLVAAALAAAALALFGLGVWSYTDMVHPPDRGSPAPHCNIGEPHCPARPPDASRLSPSPGEAREAAVARALSG